MSNCDENGVPLNYNILSKRQMMAYAPKYKAKKTIMSILSKHEYMPVSEIIDKSGCNPNTVRRNLSDLWRCGVVIKSGTHHNRSYRLA